MFLFLVLVDSFSADGTGERRSAFYWKRSVVCERIRFEWTIRPDVAVQHILFINRLQNLFPADRVPPLTAYFHLTTPPHFCNDQGYGDLCPKTKLGKLFTCIFGFAGIALLGAAVANIGTKLIQLEADTVQMVQRESRKRVLDVYEKLPHVVGHLKKKHINEDDGATKEEAEVVDMQREHLVEQVVTSKKLLPDEDHDMTTIVDVVPTSSIRSRVESAGKVLRTALIWTTKAFLPVVGGGLLIGRLEGWGAYDSIYYSLITASTIGLGDLYPKTRSGRLAAVLLIPILVATAGDILAGIGKALIERRQKRMFTAQMEKGYMNDYNIIKAMDINGDGRVSREEYVVFMLTEMGFVSKDEIDELWKQFDRLVDQSKSEGHIEAEDLLLMQAIRRRTEEV